MRDFRFVSPSSLEDALQILDNANGVVKALAGGTDLIAQMKDGKHRPSLVMDVKDVPEMNVLEYEDLVGLRIGAAVSCTDIANHPAVRGKYCSIMEACLLVGAIQIQNRASVGGNICNAAPSADTIPPLLTYDARAVVVGPLGRRELPLEEFFIGPGQTVLGSKELLVEVLVPPPPANSSGHYMRFIPREEMDIAVAGVASLVEILVETGVAARVHIALAAVAPTPVRAREVETYLEGRCISSGSVGQIGEQVALATRPISDVRGSAEYRKELVKVLTRRTLVKCLGSLGVD